MTAPVEQSDRRRRTRDAQCGGVPPRFVLPVRCLIAVMALAMAASATAQTFDERYGPGVVTPLPPPLPETNQAAPETLETVPADGGLPQRGGQLFPALPPDPYAEGLEPLPSLDEELWLHGGAQLYEAEGDQFAFGCEAFANHGEVLRLPEDWQAPQPLTWFQEFLGADPIRSWPNLYWPASPQFGWEPRLVVYGGYQLFGFASEQGNLKRSGLGQQLLVEGDLRLTGTERFHVQFRPLGKGNTGGSYYQFNDPAHYVDNATGIPERYWFEGELFSMFSGLMRDEFAPRDYHVVVGKFPFELQNAILMNDDIVGLVLNKNTIYLGNLSNLNVQVFYGFDDVDAFEESSQVVGLNAAADYRHTFIELSGAHVAHSRAAARDADYLALGVTTYVGRFSIGGRAMGKWGDAIDYGGRGGGQLYVMESNWGRIIDGPLRCQTGVEEAVFYANAFRSTPGWTPISGGNFNRLRSVFEINPLLAVARGNPELRYGAALGVQLFRHNQDESITPEVAYEAPRGKAVWGVGLTYQRKTGPRSFFEIRSLGAWSRDPSLNRSGIFVAETVLF